MASEIKVNTIKDLGGNTIVSSNGSGTFTSNLPSTTLSGSTNNTITTVTGANAIQGEAKLTFDGSVLNNVQSAGAASEIKASAASVYTKVIADDASGFSAIDYSHDLRFKDAGTEKMRIASTGKVGIGETSPLGNLHVKTGDTGATSVSGNADELIIENTGNVGMTIQSANDGVGNVYFGDVANGSVGRVSYDHSSNSMSFNTNASERMQIESDGTVMIPNAGDNGKILLEGGFSNPQIGIIGPTTSNTNKMYFSNGNGTVGSIATNGSATSFNTSSDHRLKENVNYDFDATTRLKQLKPARFNFKTNANTTVDGFIAHEVETIIPEAISGEKDAMIPEVLYKDEVLYTAEDDLPEGTSIGDVKTPADNLPEGKNFGDIKEIAKPNYQGIDQSKLVPLLTKALQEAITKIETLETKVTALENA